MANASISDIYGQQLAQNMNMQQLLHQQQSALQNPFLSNSLNSFPPPTHPPPQPESYEQFRQAQLQRLKLVSLQIKKDKSMFKEITTDIKSFLLEHRAVIYFIVFALMLDHFVFRGAFKARLQTMADKMVTKVEEKIK